MHMHILEFDLRKSVFAVNVQNTARIFQLRNVKFDN